MPKRGSDRHLRVVLSKPRKPLVETPQSLALYHLNLGAAILGELTDFEAMAVLPIEEPSVTTAKLLLDELRAREDHFSIPQFAAIQEHLLLSLRFLLG